MTKNILTVLCASTLLTSPVWAEEPPLPMGLGGPVSSESSSEPALPAGLGGDEPSLPAGLSSDEPSLPSGLSSSSEPALPVGLGSDESEFAAEGERSMDDLPFLLSGFIEGRAGVRLKDDTLQKKMPIGEARIQLQAEKNWERLTGRITTDFVYDGIVAENDTSLETGDGIIDVREAFLVGQPTGFTDLKVGRQILTWGTGDLFFINDMFPKDWNSFFIGRDEDYLKAPSDAVKLSVFSDAANLDVVYTPRFDPDRFMDGRRISYYDGNTGFKAGTESQIHVETHDDWFADDEWSARLYRNFGTAEAALYAYDGYWKSPAGQNQATSYKTFPELSVYGASVRAPIAKGIANVEVGYYDSTDDPDGDDANIPNSEARLLVGYEQELAPNLTGGVQYYVEHKRDYSDYRRTLPASAKQKDKNRQVVTARLTKLMMNQNLTLSAFNFYSPSDQDGYARLRATYKIDDNWRVEGGANLFYGEDDHTFFGQYDDNNNVYTSVRYSF